jgi:tripartite-type tricarboxylate transporter receptor subunit TctC
MGRVASLLLALCLAASTAAHGQPFPNKTITFVVPFAAGSGTDTVARLLAHHLGIALAQTVIVENKAGANGVIAAQHVARSAPDGYTLLVATNTTHSANPAGMIKNVPYDAINDFAPVVRVGNYIFVLLVNKDVPATSLKELIAYGKANPGKLSFASGNGTGIVAGKALAYWTGLDLLHVPYRSTPPATNDVLGGRVSMIVVDIITTLPHIQAGTLRALAVTTKGRTPLLPDLPSLHEQGLENYDITSWCGIFAPANTPKEVVGRLNGELRKIIDSPEVKQRLANVGFEAISSTPEGLDEFVKAQLVLWKRLIKDTGIEAQ